MNILLSAFIGSHNLGDEAIADIVIGKLESVAEFDKITVLSIAPSKTREMTASSKTRVVKAGFINFFKELRQTDALLLGGGGIIQDESSVVNILYYYLQSVVANMFMKKPIYLIFVGVGPIKSRLGAFILHKMRNRISYALVRDVESKELLVHHGFDAEAIDVAYDVVFNMPAVSRAKKSAPADNYILFCPRDWFFTRTYIPTKYALKLAKRDKDSEFYKYRNSLLKFITNTLDCTDLTIVGVAFFYTQDKDLIEWIKSKLPDEFRPRFITTEETSPREYVQLAKGARAVVGVRLHSLILAAVAEVPVVPLVYSSKVKSLVHYMSWQNFTTYLRQASFSSKETLAKLQAAITLPEATIYVKELKHIQKRNDKAFGALVNRLNSKL